MELSIKLPRSHELEGHLEGHRTDVSCRLLRCAVGHVCLVLRGREGVAEG